MSYAFKSELPSPEEMTLTWIAFCAFLLFSLGLIDQRRRLPGCNISPNQFCVKLTLSDPIMFN